MSCIKSFIKELQWTVYSHIPNWKGISKINNNLIVSLTSYPERINEVILAIKSLLMQSLKPEKIILWLSPEQFKDKEKSLPKKLLALKKFGLTIDWYRDIKSFKKLIPALKKYPNSIIFTTDDDVIYNSRVLKEAFYTHIKYPDFIISHRITKFYIEKGIYKDISGGTETYKTPSFLHKLTGVGGVLYPPNCLHKDVLNEELFMQLCPTNDDIWFWLMGVLNGKKIVIPNHNFIKLTYIGKTQKKSTLTSINDSKEGLFWKQFYNILRYYPQIDSALRKEYETLSITDNTRSFHK